MQGCRVLSFAVLCIVSLVGGCETTRMPAASLTAQATLAQAERLMRDRQYANAAHLYEDLARDAAADARNTFLLRAAHSWLRAEDLPRGENLLREIGDVPAGDVVLKSLAVAEAALLERRPERTLAELDRIPQPYTRE